jgi:hypothetical protein
VFNPFAFKYINLSYNSLNFKEGTPECEHSTRFVDLMIKYIKASDMLNHLDLSGLQLPHDSLISLASVLCDCQNLMGIHLNDIGVMHDDNLMLELLDTFGLGEGDIKSICRAKLEHTGTSLQRRAEQMSNPHHIESKDIL